MGIWTPDDKERHEAFVHAAQYIMSLTMNQDVYENLCGVLVNFFKVDWAAFVRPSPAGAVIVKHSPLPEAGFGSRLLAEGRDIFENVIATGFLASQAMRLPEAHEVLCLPIHLQGRVREAIIVAYATEKPMPKELLDLFLALSVLAENAIEKTAYTRELLMHRDNLQSLVKERTAEIEKKNGELAMILKEVHHRIKNNMSSIVSLLSLHASLLKEPQAIEALEDAQSRVQSMMILYDRLYRSSNFISARVKDYLPSLVEEIADNFHDRSRMHIETEVEDFELDTISLLPLGIIVNELLTNIMKYAFKGRDSGQIKLSTSLMEDAVVRMEIQDDGIGIPENINFKNSTGFGLMLIDNLTQQLKGSIRIERGIGTRIVLEFPKGTVAASAT